MSEALSIRDANRADVAFIADSNAAMARETEQKTLDHGLLVRGIESVFQIPTRGFYLVAERDGRAVGCLLVTYEWSDWRNGEWWWLQSVYVVPDARRGGVFRAMHEEVARRAEQAADVVGLRLYVETENSRAQATYAALGMQEAHYRMFERPRGAF